MLDVDSEFDTQIDRWCEAMTQYIENITGRVFQVVTGSGDDGSEDKYYDGNGNTDLLIDDAIDIDGVEIGDYEGNSLVANTTFIKYPKTPPYRKLVLLDGWNHGIQNVKVSGIFAFSEEVPADIEFIATVLVAGVIKASQNKLGKKSEKIGNYAVTFVDDKQVADFDNAIQILNSYKKYVI